MDRLFLSSNNYEEDGRYIIGALYIYIYIVDHYKRRKKKELNKRERIRAGLAPTKFGVQQPIVLLLLLLLYAGAIQLESVYV